MMLLTPVSVSTARCAAGADILSCSPVSFRPSSRPLRPAQQTQLQAASRLMHRQSVARQRPRAAETEVETSSAEGSLDGLDTALASSEARTARSDEHVGPDMSFGLLLALAAAGAAETGYLTVSKLTNATVACPTAGSCETVLNSDYAQLFGIPLSAFGFATYVTVAALAFTGLQSRSKGSSARGNVLRLGTLAGGTVLATTSSWLMFILFTKFPGDSCAWCLTSALLSLSILATATRGFSGRELQEVAAPGGGLAVTLFLSLAFVFRDVDVSSANVFDLPYNAPVVSTLSPPRAVDLARRLKAAGAKMYGAFWCSHCFDQKQAFGKEAMADFPYVECYPDGFRKEAQINPACTAAGLEGFPTWVIGGQKLSGEQSFDKLEAALAKSAS